MRKPNAKSLNLLNSAIRVEQLPAVVPRGVAVDFSQLSRRTLLRAEKLGRLRPIRRNKTSVGYRRENLLEFLGLL
jgi:hypothetical protein